MVLLIDKREVDKDPIFYLILEEAVNKEGLFIRTINGSLGWKLLLRRD